MPAPLRVRALSALLLCLLLPTAAAAQKLATGSGPGASPAVRVFDASGTDTSFFAYDPLFPGGVRIALGDVTGDGVLDIITGAGPTGGPHVRVWNGTDLTEVGGFFAYDPAFPGGVFVAAADVNGDGRADIITGAGAGGGPHVRVWSGADFTEIGGFFAYDPAFPGGVNVAAADINGDGLADIITGAGPGGGPHVRIWNATDFSEIGGFFAYDPAFPGGVNVAAADVDGDGRADIVTGAGPGGGPHVRVWSGATFAEIGGFFAYDPAFPGGVTVGTVDLDRDGRHELVTGPATGLPLVRLWTGTTFVLFGEYVAFGTPGSGVSIGSTGGTSTLRFTSANATAFSVGTPGTFAITTTGGASVPALTVTGTLPTGVSFTDNGDRSATLAGTPAAGTGGSYPLTFTATLSGRPPVTQSFTLTINQAPAITSAAATTFSLGAPGTFTVTTTGVPAPQLTVAGPLPSGVTFIDNGSGTGTLSGTPAPGTGGPYVLAISASNGIGTGAIQNFTLTVSGAPAITSANTTTFTVGSAGTFTVTAVGTPTPALTVTGSLPAGVTLLDNGNGTGTLSGTPAAGTGGSYAITFTAANGLLPNGTQAFTLNVNQAPAITSAASTTFTVGAAGSFTVTTSGFPSAALTRGGVALPAGVTFVDNGNGTGTLSGTPAAGTGGTHAITFTATNTAASSAPQAFTLIVNQAPTITSGNTTGFTVGAPGTFTVTALGTPTPALTVTGSLPAGVTFIDNGSGTGTLSGTPAAGTGGVHAITFTASNGVLPNGTQAFTLNVNQAPAITSANSTAFAIGTAGSFTVTTSGFPAPALTAGGAALPAGITFVDNGNGTGTLSGTAAAGTGGTYAITFTATNTAGSSVQAFTLIVNQAPTITSANTTSFTVGAPGTFTVTTTATPVAAISVTGAMPAGVTFVDNGNGTGTLSGTPAAGTAAAYAITFTATNGVLPDGVQAFTLNVQQPPAITSANATTFTVGAPGAFTVTTTGFPTPTVTQTGTLPTGVTFTSATRVLGGTATQTGAFPLQFTAANGVPPDAVQNFTLNVVCPAITVTPGTMVEGLYQTAYGGVDFNQTGSTGSIFTWGATGLPAGLSIDASTGVVSGPPTNTVLNGAVVVTVTDNFGCTGSVNTTVTVRPTTDNENYTGGVGNTQYVVGATVPSTPHVFFNDNVKTGDNGPGVLSVAFGPAVNGTVAEGPTDGTFTYTPNVGFAGPTDTFSYTLTDGNGVTNSATVTINLSGLVWYVNGSVGNGDGRSHLPFNSVTNAQAPSGDGQVIYVHTGGATTPGTITLKLSQTLWGAGETFVLNSLTIPFTGFPTLAGTVTLATGVLVNSLNVNGSGAPAITGTNVGGNVALNSVNVIGGTTGITLTNLTGNLTFQFTTVSGITPGASFLLAGGTGSATGRLGITSTVGRSVDIQGKTAGTVTLGGGISDTGSGIFLNANTGATIVFTGGLALNTGTNPGFTATGGGTVSASQNNTTVVNTITTTTGTALNVSNTTIGAGGLTFRSISSSGGSSTGIILDTTGSVSGLTITGNGGAGSGGTIANKTGADGSTGTGIGIYLNNTAHVSLDRLLLNDFSNFAIRGFNVSAFTLANSTVNALAGLNGDNGGVDEGSVVFGDFASVTGATGVVNVTNSVIANGIEDNFRIVNHGGSLTFNMTGTTIRDTSTISPGNNGLLLQAEGSAMMAIDIDTSAFLRNRANGIQIINQSTDTVTANIGNAGAAGSGGTFTDNNIGVNIAANDSGATNYNVLNGSFTTANYASIFGAGGASSQININLGGAAVVAERGAMTGNLIGNVIDNAGSSTGPGMRIIANGTDGTGGNTLTVKIEGNTVSNVGNFGIHVLTRDGNATINATIRNNTVSTTVGLGAESIRVDAGATSTAAGTGVPDSGTINLDVAGNSANTPDGNGLADIRIRQRFNTTYRLESYSGPAADAAAVIAFVSGLNAGAAVAADHVATGSGGFLNIGSVLEPPTP